MTYQRGKSKQITGSSLMIPRLSQPGRGLTDVVMGVEYGYPEDAVTSVSGTYEIDALASASFGPRIANIEGALARLANAPRTVMLATLDSPIYHLRSPIPVTLQSSADGCVAESADLEAYGDGASEYEALDSLRMRIAETIDDLSAEAALAPRLQRLFARMTALIEKRS
jgi:hypothetical protein